MAAVYVHISMCVIVCWMGFKERQTKKTKLKQKTETEKKRIVTYDDNQRILLIRLKIELKKLMESCLEVCILFLRQ